MWSGSSRVAFTVSCTNAFLEVVFSCLADRVSLCAAQPQVRDMLTTDHEQQLKAKGLPGPASSLRRDAVRVDAVVSTIGFPLASPAQG